ncbi:MAG TPA: alpha/beta family hydrolase [Gemmatimonadaceae bacterium]|nr:alpha/beta family hydrolase [Gemmatimonadaceae bacterium]
MLLAWTDLLSGIDVAYPSMATRWKVAVGAEQTSAVLEQPTAEDSGALFVCAHGAGGHMDDRGMLQLASELRSHGVTVVRFNFMYKEKKSGRPDPMPRLKECFAAVVAHTLGDVQPKLLLIGGRSMGGRAASMLAADGFECDGLLLLAYPLHPAGKPEQLRDKHLASINVPVLCFNGTRDALCRRDLMETALAGVKTRWDMHWLESADHSFHVLKSSGTTDAQVLADIGEETERWVADLSPRRSLLVP